MCKMLSRLVNETVSVSLNYILNVNCFLFM